MNDAPHGSSPPPPAGWYPDPQQPGWQRYWDGAAWTEHAAPPAPPGAPVPATAVAGDASSRQWAMLAHLSALAGLLVGLNWLGPLIVYLVKRQEDAFVADQAREALNFNLSFFLYGVAGFVVTFVLFFLIVGVLLIPVLIAMGIAWLVLVIVAGVQANNGQAYRYPVTIRFLS